MNLYFHFGQNKMDKEEKKQCKCGQSQDPDGFCDGSHAAQKSEV